MAKKNKRKSGKRRKAAKRSTLFQKANPVKKAKRRSSGKRASRSSGKRSKSFVSVGSRGFAAKELVITAGLATGGLIGGNLLADLIGKKIDAVSSGWGRVALKGGIGVAAYAAARKPLGNAMALALATGPVIAALLDTYGNFMAKRAATSTDAASSAGASMSALAEYRAGAIEAPIGLEADLAGLDPSPVFVLPANKAFA
jgi:hypothetical protein